MCPVHDIIAYRPAMVPGGMQPPSYQQAGQKPGGLVHMPSSLPELTAKLHNSSYSVAGMTMVDILNHFFGVLILGGDRTALPPTDAMLRLLDEFVVNPFPGRDGGHQGPTALEVLRFINCFRKYLESSSDKNVKLCVFDAIFGTDVVDIIESSVSCLVVIYTVLLSNGSGMAPQDHSIVLLNNGSGMAPQDHSIVLLSNGSGMAPQDHSIVLLSNGSGMAPQDHSIVLLSNGSGMAPQDHSIVLLSNGSGMAPQDHSIVC